MSKIYYQLNRKNETGFTIIETMFAITIFSLVLIVFILGVVRVSQSYYRGITETNVQDTVRTILGDITSSIQFEGASPVLDSNGGNAWCIGNQLYIENQGKEVEQVTPDSTRDQAYHGLYLQPVTCTGGATGTNIAAYNLSVLNPPPGTGKELLGPRMRLSSLNITCITSGGCPSGSLGLWQIQVTIAVGEDDQLINPTSAQPKCNVGSGSDFCFVETLTSVVAQRLNQ